MKKIAILTAAAIIGLTGCTFVGTREKVQPIEQNIVDTSQSFYMIPVNDFCLITNQYILMHQTPK